MSARGAITRDFPPILTRLIPRLGSPFDHERLATVAAIERTLRSNRQDFHDLAAALTAPTRRPAYRAESSDSAEMRAWLEVISREPWLNDWSRDFVASLLVRDNLDRLSKKQVACANNIVAEAHRRGVRV